MKRKRILLFIFLLGGIILSAKSQATQAQTHSIYCEKISTQDAADFVGNYFLTNYPDKIINYKIDLTSKKASIETTFQPVDIVQLYLQQGYEAIYIYENERYELTPSGEYLKMIKQF